MKVVWQTGQLAVAWVPAEYTVDLLDHIWIQDLICPVTEVS